MSAAVLDAIQEVIQEDVGGRGLRSDPASNLITNTAGDFEAACRGIAETPEPAVAIVTGFFIPHASPPCGETDGPLGALFLARALVPLGVKVILATDPFCSRALEIGLAVSGLRKQVPLMVLPPAVQNEILSPADYRQRFAERAGPLTHLIALERVGPSHSLESLSAHPASSPAHLEQFQREVPAEHHDRCHTMKGRDITHRMSPAHLLFEPEARRERSLVTIGIGDGGNEIGMGKLSWNVIRRNIPGGGLVACRVPADHLVVCGISNWGAYGLGAGVGWLRGQPPDADLFDPERERDLLERMVEGGPLVDGVLGEPAVSVDGLDFDRYAEPLRRLKTICVIKGS